MVQYLLSRTCFPKLTLTKKNDFNKMTIVCSLTDIHPFDGTFFIIFLFYYLEISQLISSFSSRIVLGMSV